MYLRNFRNSWITSVIRKCQGSEGVMKMLGEANEALSPLSYIKDDLTSCKGLDGMVPVVLHTSSEVARYTAHADDVRGLVTSSAKVEEVSKDIGRYEAVTGTKINCEKSVGF